MSLEAERIKGADAQALLDNPILKEAFERVGEHVEQQAYQCDPNDQKRAANIIITKQLLVAVQREIMRMVEDGDVAKVQIDEIEKQRKLRVFRR